MGDDVVGVKCRAEVPVTAFDMGGCIPYNLMITKKAAVFIFGFLINDISLFISAVNGNNIL